MALYVIHVLFYAAFWFLWGCAVQLGGRRRVAVVLGSGGHTAEMLRMLVMADMLRDVVYWVAWDDKLSISKLGKSARIVLVPRPRRVGQSQWTSVPSCAHCLLVCLYRLSHHWPAKLVCNGPAMCVIVALAVNAMRLLSLGLVPEMTIVYVESVARVKSLSLSGKIMRYLADQFVVQWPDLLTVDLERRFGAKCALVV